MTNFIVVNQPSVNYNNLGNTPTAFTSEGYPWNSLSQDLVSIKPPKYAAEQQQFATWTGIGSVPTPFVSDGNLINPLTQDIVKKPYPAAEQKFNFYNNLGGTPSALKLRGFTWNNLTQELIVKPFNSDHQQFTAYPPEGDTPTVNITMQGATQDFIRIQRKVLYSNLKFTTGQVSTPLINYGNAQNLLTQDIIIPPFNSAQQQFSSFPPQIVVTANQVLNLGGSLNQSILPYQRKVIYQNLKVPFQIVPAPFQITTLKDTVQDVVKKPFNSALQQKSTWAPRGNIPTPFVNNAYPDNILTQPIIAKPFSASQQQTTSLGPNSKLSTPFIFNSYPQNNITQDVVFKKPVNPTQIPDVSNNNFIPVPVLFKAGQGWGVFNQDPIYWITIINEVLWGTGPSFGPPYVFSESPQFIYPPILPPRLMDTAPAYPEIPTTFVFNAYPDVTTQTIVIPPFNSSQQQAVANTSLTFAVTPFTPMSIPDSTSKDIIKYPFNAALQQDVAQQFRTVPVAPFRPYPWPNNVTQDIVKKPYPATQQQVTSFVPYGNTPIPNAYPWNGITQDIVTIPVHYLAANQQFTTIGNPAQAPTIFVAPAYSWQQDKNTFFFLQRSNMNDMTFGSSFPPKPPPPFVHNFDWLVKARRRSRYN